MPGKNVQCSYCSKVMRSDNLKDHVKIHERQGHMKTTHGITVNNKEREIPTFDGSEFGTGKPKSKETMDKLKRFVRNNTVVTPPPLKKVRMDTNDTIPTAVLKKCLKPKRQITAVMKNR